MTKTRLELSGINGQREINDRALAIYLGLFGSVYAAGLGIPSGGVLGLRKNGSHRTWKSYLSFTESMASSIFLFPTQHQGQMTSLTTSIFIRCFEAILAIPRPERYREKRR